MRIQETGRPSRCRLSAGCFVQGRNEGRTSPSATLMAVDPRGPYTPFMS
ncbi:hypothetical protein HMPREF9946_04778 [Acetobacteraceae bacterium AT-5844]|nr:hypothetical protein HMPREF9946_04778 [Acetobacteraceae bacterium AT-5844]